MNTQLSFFRALVNEVQVDGDLIILDVYSLISDGIYVDSLRTGKPKTYR